VLAADGSRYVSTDTISNVLRRYRKHLDLSPEEGAIVERLSNACSKRWSPTPEHFWSTSPARSVEHAGPRERRIYKHQILVYLTVTLRYTNY
jgi:hypothetical protein